MQPLDPHAFGAARSDRIEELLHVRARQPLGHARVEADHHPMPPPAQLLDQGKPYRN